MTSENHLLNPEDPNPSKEDIRKAYLFRMYLTYHREHIGGVTCAYPPSDFPKGGKCPLCEEYDYYHAQVFSFDDIKKIGGTICLSCFDDIVKEVRHMSEEDIKPIEEYCRNLFGDEAFDFYKNGEIPQPKT